MKSSFFFLLFVLLTESQLHAQNWEAKIIVQHPFTYEQDTAWIGFDVNAGYGYQEGYDILDTHFYSKSIAIRGYDPLIAKHPGYCVNLKRNILKPTEKGTIDFILYVHCDTNDYKIDGHDTMNRTWLIWDTTDFLHSPAQFEVISAVAYGNGGYFYAMDSEEQWLFHKPLNNTRIVVFGNKVHLLLFSEQQCEKSLYSMRIVVRVWINQGVHINEPEQMKGIKVYPNPVQDFLNITHQEGALPGYSFQLYHINGQLLLEDQIEFPYQQNIQNLPPGLYFLKVTDSEGNTFNHKIIKQ